MHETLIAGLQMEKSNTVSSPLASHRILGIRGQLFLNAYDSDDCIGIPLTNHPSLFIKISCCLSPILLNAIKSV